MSRPIDNLPPIHPGEFLRDELDTLGISARRFSVHIHMPHNAVTEIMNGQRSITAQMAIRLAKAFGTTPQYWLNLQSIYDLKMASTDMPDEVLQIEPFVVAGCLVRWRI
jgi:antitoxin HigA-1